MRFFYFLLMFANLLTWTLAKELEFRRLVLIHFPNFMLIREKNGGESLLVEQLMIAEGVK